MRVAADLHVHSNASDGAHSPTEVVQRARSSGIVAVAITDHDTLGGIGEALSASRGTSLSVVAGTELSARSPRGTLHILGYFPCWPSGLEAELASLERARRERIPRIVDRLRGLGMDITEQDVETYAARAVPGRPHVARVLVDKGFASSVDDAFHRFLARGRPGYVPKAKPSVRDALALVRDHGGIPVLAHPSSLGMDRGELRRFVRFLARSGLEGIEAFHPDHGPGETAHCIGMAEALGLLVTGGSDYHGLEDHECPIGAVGIDESRLEAFLARLGG
ncbi:MAG TPA: PHP domain-containing protein [Deltaproteobacteria bacterium]|mgnify:CR=1 FL=1|nr:PHP domain-containing protein [Deltaproteobacteria bacterium]HOM28888.1 PHP domain-containing protein [Deltaproteobacteria bacterium]HPP81358.1 PHP domain-containing protein [Deltaproteobacteria bacterium]